MISFEDIETNSADFDAYMNEIDARLREAAIPIHARPLRAFRQIALDGMSLVVSGALPHPHADRIIEWFERRYGARLLVDFSIGKAVILVRGDPYMVSLPLIYGNWDGVLDVFETFGMTKELFSVLPEADRSDMISAFVWLYRRFQQMESLPRDTLVNIPMAVSQMMALVPHYGESQWASLQSAEKALKQYVRRRHGTPPTIHDLDRLLIQAEQHGLKKGLWPLLSMIQCSAGVRYNNGVSLETAVIAHHASIDLCAAIAEQLSAKESDLERWPTPMGEVAVSFGYLAKSEPTDGVLFRFIMDDRSEHFLLFPHNISLVILDYFVKCRHTAPDVTIRPASLSPEFRNASPRTPVRLFRANKPAVGDGNFLKPSTQIGAVRIDDFKDGVRFRFRTTKGSEVAIVIHSTILPLFADGLEISRTAVTSDESISRS